VFLKGLLETKDHLKYIAESKIKKVKKTTTKINICYNNKDHKDMKEFYIKHKGASTVHMSQGLTINEKYTIHQIDRMSFKIAYTALSRATGFDGVCLCI